MPKLASVLKQLRPNPIRRLSGYIADAARRKDIISFGGGAPSLPPPPEVVQAINTALRKDPQKAASYGSTQGIFELREGISSHLKKYGGIDIDPKTEITIADGGTQALLLSILALFNPGDKVIIFDPTYLAYPDLLRLAGVKPVPVPVHVANGYQPEIEAIEEVAGDVRGIILSSPDNPTGRIIKRELAKAIADIAIENDLWILSDDIYKYIIYEGEHVWISKLPGAEERTVTQCSYSKTASVPGLRLGYIYGPKEVVDAVIKIEQYMALCPNTLSQIGVLALYQNDVQERYLRETVLPTYRERRDVMEKALKQYLPEAKTARPSGAFYFFVDLSSYMSRMGKEDEPFNDELVSRKDVVCIPGSYFGDNGRQHLRMTFVSEPRSRITEGIRRMGEFVGERRPLKAAKPKAISRP